MMTDKNKELLTELMAAIYAKDILEKIEDLMSKSDSTVIEKKEIRTIIEQSSEKVYFE